MGCGPSSPSSVGESGRSAQNPFKAVQNDSENCRTLADIEAVLRAADVAACELIVGVDCTKSNPWAGEQSPAKSQDATLLDGSPYRSTIRTLGRALAPFRSNNSIPLYGIGAADAQDSQSLLAFAAAGDLDGAVGNEASEAGSDACLRAYDAAMPNVQPGSLMDLSPVIYKAVDAVRRSSGRYHVLLIVCSGQIICQNCCQRTMDAIVEASNYALSIVMIGVSDGPFSDMQGFDTGLPSRAFKNFHFVNFASLYDVAKQQGYDSDRWQAQLAGAALSELPEQHAHVRDLGLLGQERPARVPEVPTIDFPDSGSK